MRRPFIVTAAGVGLGLASVLPLARGQLTLSTRPPAAVAVAPAGVTTDAPASAVVRGATAPPVKVPVVTVPAVGLLTATGPSVSTRYGPVQVQLQMSGDRITSATALQLPSGDRRSQRISNSSGPVLAQEAVQAQNAQIDTVSGATYTSRGYRTSLQAALDSARTQSLTAVSG